MRLRRRITLFEESYEASLTRLRNWTPASAPPNRPCEPKAPLPYDGAGVRLTLSCRMQQSPLFSASDSCSLARALIIVLMVLWVS